ncbi:MAG: nitroreductase family protein [Firmicutes bacterium]|nr:nitroreductase family protein [Bacillota bacterium]
MSGAQQPGLEIDDAVASPARLHAAIARRHAVRTYLERPLDLDHVRMIREACRASASAASGARVVFVAARAERVFTGLVGSYGRIRGAQAFLAMIGDTAQPHVEETVGYAGEYVILAATAAGVGSCWVSGTFSPDVVASLVDLSPGEKVFAVSPLGYPAEPSGTERIMKALARSATRKPVERLLTPESLSLASCPQWVKQALEAARLAPSALNRQPWRFTVSAEGIRVSVEREGGQRRLDCGIAMLHLELGARAAGVQTKWRWLEGPLAVAYLACQ